jgi:hypothetical protein
MCCGYLANVHKISPDGGNAYQLVNLLWLSCKCPQISSDGGNACQLVNMLWLSYKCPHPVNQDLHRSF